MFYLLNPVLRPRAIFIVFAIIGAILGFLGADPPELRSSRDPDARGVDPECMLCFLLKLLTVPFFSWARFTPRGGFATEST